MTVVARPGSRRLTQLQRDGGIVLAGGGRASLTVADHLDEQAPFDLVIVTVLAHQAVDLLPALQASRARCIHFMFVTPEAALLRSAVGANRATFGMAAVLATLDSTGKLELSIPKTKGMHGDQRWVDLFEAAGMPSALEEDMGRWLRSQVPLTIAMEGVAVAGMQHQRGATWAEARTGAKTLRAGYAILRGLGETPYPGVKNQISRAPRPLLRSSCGPRPAAGTARRSGARPRSAAASSTSWPPRAGVSRSCAQRPTPCSRCGPPRPAAPAPRAQRAPDRTRPRKKSSR